MLPSGDQLVSRISGAPSPSSWFQGEKNRNSQQVDKEEHHASEVIQAQATQLYNPAAGGFGSFAPQSYSSALAAADGDPYAAGYDMGSRMFQNWMLQGGLNRLMGESCVFKGAIAYTMGGLMGLAMGAFLAPFDSMNGLKVAENATAKETAMATIHQTRTKAMGMARTFSAIGGIYGVTECVIEKYRAKSDMNNAVYAGCVTGGALGRSAGAMGMAYGCAGFALWSAGMEKLLRSDLMAGSSLAGGSGDH